jgi:hypothetical protein
MTAPRGWWYRRAVMAAVFGVAAGLLSAAPASAHTVGGIQPSNYRTEITAISPALPGVSISLYNLGHRVRLTNRTDADVVVLGYSGEPFLRIGPGGVEENIRSATYLDSPEPLGGQSIAPDWRPRATGRTATWADRRTFWTGAAPAGVAKSPGVEQFVVASWTIPVQAGATVADVSGRIVWVPGPSVWPWLALVLAMAGATIGVGLSRWWGVGLSTAMAVLVALDAVHTWGIAAAPGGGVGVEVGRLLTAGGFSVGAWVIGILAIDPLQRHREGGLLAAAIAGAVIAIFGGLGDITSLGRSQLPVIFPAGPVRVAVAASLGLGVGLVAAAVFRLRSMPVAAVPEPAAPGAPASGGSTAVPVAAPPPPHS